MNNRNTFACLAVSLLGLILCAGPSQAAETKISGTISTTITITQDSELVSGTSCTLVSDWSCYCTALRRQFPPCARQCKKNPGNVFSVAALIYGLGHAGRKKEAKRHLDQLSREYEYVPCWFLAMSWVGLNDSERALEALEQALRDHEPCMVSLKVDAIFDPLRTESRFTSMIRQIGLEP